MDYYLISKYSGLILWPLSSDWFQALIKDRPGLENLYLGFAKFELCFTQALCWNHIHNLRKHVQDQANIYKHQ